MVRGAEWWDFKLVPILLVFYIGAIRLDVAVAALWRPLLILLGALAAGAVYVSLINDWTDLAEDRAAGKVNRLVGKRPSAIVAALALVLVPGAAFGFVWRGSPALLLLYAAAWLSFTLYSVPPARLKVRGIAGIVADAAGANLLPGLLAAVLVTTSVHRRGDPLFLVAAGCWLFAYGVRGIVWHQLVDAEADRLAGVRTFVQRRGTTAAVVLGARMAFPLELAAMATILLTSDIVAGTVALLFYAGLAIGRVLLFQMRCIVVVPRPRGMLMLQEWYDVLLPAAMLASSAPRHPADGLVLAGHLLIFPRRPLQILRDLRRIVRRAPAWRHHWRAAVHDP